MQLFLSSLNVVFPLFIMMAAGWFIKRIKLISDSGLDELNRINVRLFLPVMLFSNICEGSLLDGASPAFLLFATAAAVILFVICMLLVPLFIPNKDRCAAFVLGIYRPNTAIYGLPLAQSILGNSEQISNVLMMVAIYILITNFFAVMAVEIFKGEKLRPVALIWRSIKNPIIYGLLLGTAVQFLPFSLPQIIMSPVKSIAAVATPIAFVALGATFTLEACKRNMSAVSGASLLKLVITPLIALPIGIFAFGFRDQTLVAMLCSFATPTAVSTLPIIKDAGGDDALMGEIIVVTTGLSIVSIFGFVYFFKFIGLL